MNREEFEKSLLQPLRFWGDKDAAFVDSMLGTEAAAMVEYDQRNPHHCYDLFLHTLHTVNNLGEKSSILLKVAAFFHDIGKPAVAKEKDGRLVFYGHAKKSEEIASAILESLGYTDEEWQKIAFWIGHHDDFISWELPHEDYGRKNPYLKVINRKTLDEYINKLKLQLDKADNELFGLLEQLLKLCIADASAQADEVVMKGSIVDTRENKILKLREIQKVLEDWHKN